MNALVGLVRPLRIALWVVGSGYLLWWLYGLLSALLGASSRTPAEQIFVWGALPGLAFFGLNGVLSVFDPYTARKRREKEQER